MHGEFKVPGGKLVVVDLEVVDGVIRDFSLAGDFFLEPDSALADINAAVNVLPADSDAKRMTEVIQSALPKDAVLLGFTPEAVATTLRRALAQATSFTDYKWEIIHGQSERPQLQMALDQVLAEEVGEGRRGPTLRIWEWDQPAVVIGSFQSVRNEVDPENAAKWVIVALKSLGIDAFYQPLNDITSAKGKIGGAAQKRLGTGAVLHHVTMSYDMDGDKMVEVLRIGREKMSDKGTRSANKRVDPLRSQTGLSRAEIIDTLIATFRKLYGGTDGELTADERAKAEKLVAEKFGTDEWLYRVP
jgi:lipoate---protein ligase